MPVMEEPVTVSIENLLLATDFSRASEKAAAYALGMALRFGASVEVAHVFDPSVVTTYEEAILEMPLASRERAYGVQLRCICDSLGQQGIVSHAHLPVEHDPARALLKLARECRAELIVTGTQSKRGLERMLLGSTAESLIRHAACPVLTVGPSARWPVSGPLTFQRIVFATDLSVHSAKALPYALSFAEDSGAHLSLCLVMEEKSLTPHQEKHLKEAFGQGMKSMIPERAYDWCTPECLVKQGEAAKTILAVAERVDADLIVLGARPSSFWLSFVEHGVTPEVVAGAACPVMTIC